MSVLIYDIGLHDGGDTGHYLKEGARVVAIDANPAMCAAAEKNFRDYTATGQLKIINCGIAAHRGQSEFWICDNVTQWSSFHLEIASRNEEPHHSIYVECTPISEIIDEFGVAEYMKIDIEGNDRVCISDLTCATSPKYISIEMDHGHGDQDIKILCNLGYRGFKIICQDKFWDQVTTRNMSFYDPMVRNGPHQNRWIMQRCIENWRRVRSKWSGRRFGESGPWGEKTSGFWHSADHAYEVWRFLHELDERLGPRWGLGGWYDIHARK